MSNRFLNTGYGDLDDGTTNIIASKVGAVNLKAGSTVKVDSNNQFVSASLLMSDIRGLNTALAGRLSNPSSVPIVAPSFVKSGGTSSQYLMADGSTTTGGGGGGGGATGATGASGPTGPTGPKGEKGDSGTGGGGGGWPVSLLYDADLSSTSPPVTFQAGDNMSIQPRLWDQFGSDSRNYTYTVTQSVGTNDYIVYTKSGTIPATITARNAYDITGLINDVTDTGYTEADRAGALVYNSTTNKFEISASNYIFIGYKNTHVFTITSPLTMGIAEKLETYVFGDLSPTVVVAATSTANLSIKVQTFANYTWTPDLNKNYTFYEIIGAMNDTVSSFTTNSNTKLRYWFGTGLTNDRIYMTNTNITFLINPSARMSTITNILFGTYGALINAPDPNTYTALSTSPVNIPPAPTGKVRWNNTPNAATQIYISTKDVSNVDLLHTLNQSPVGSVLKIHNRNNAGTCKYYILVSEPDANSDYVTLYVTLFIDGGAIFTTGEPLLLTLDGSSGGGGGGSGATGPTGPTGASGSFDKNTAGLFRWELFNPAIVVNNLTSITIPRQTNSVAVSSKVFSLANCGYIYSVTLPDISALGEGTGAVTGGNSFNVGMSYVSGILYIDSLGVQRMNIWKVSGETTHIAVGTAILAPAGATYRIYYDGTSANITIQQNALTQGVVGYSYTVTTPILFSIFTEDVVSMGFIGTQVSSPPVSITVNDISFVSAPISVGGGGGSGATGPTGPTGASGSFDRNTAGLFRWDFSFGQDVIVNNLTSVTIPRKSNSYAKGATSFPLRNCGNIFSVKIPNISALGEGTGDPAGGNSFCLGGNFIYASLYNDSLGVQRMNIWQQGTNGFEPVSTAILAPVGSTYRQYYNGDSITFTIQELATFVGVFGYSYTITIPMPYANTVTDDFIVIGFFGEFASDPPVSITVEDIIFTPAPISVGGSGATGATGATGPVGLSSSSFIYRPAGVDSGVPDSGYIIANSQFATAVTMLSVSYNDDAGRNINTILNSVAINSTFLFSDKSDPTRFVNFLVTGKTQQSGYIDYSVQYVDHYGVLTAGSPSILDIIVPKGIQGNQGEAGLSSSLFEYVLDRNSFTQGGIASGDVRTNNADYTLSTYLYFSHLDAFNHDVERFIGAATIGSHILIQQKTNSTNYVTYAITAVETLVGASVRFGVTYLESVGLASLSNNVQIFTAFQFIIAPTISVNSTTTGSAGTNATVTNSGTDTNVLLNFTIPRGDQGIQGITGSNATNPNFTASVTSSGTGVTPAVTLTGTYPNLALGFALKNGADGTSGSSTEFEYTFTQFSYYGTVPTVNTFNMVSAAMLNIGTSVSIGTNTGINQLTKTYHVKSNYSAAGVGASCGWVGTSTFAPFYVGQGFRVTYSFGLLDSTTNSPTRTLIGFGNFNTAVTLNAAVTIASLTNQFLGIIQEAGSNVWSFYTRGTGVTTPTATSITCQTPNTGWYTVTFQNDVNSADVLITLKYVVGGVVSTATQTYTCGGANTLSTSQACYPILQRTMTTSVAGAAILAIGGLKFYTR